MINYDRVAGKIFAIIKGHGFNLSMFTEDGMDTSEPEDGRRFYVKKPNFMITLDEDNDEIKINKNSNVTLEEIEGILKQMRNLAKENLLNTQVKVFGKEIAPKDFAYQAKKYRNKDMSGMNETPVTEASLSRMHGSKKTSYQTLESVKLIVRHRKAVDEDVRGSRSRQIQAIFLEQAGERFRFPHNSLAGARAMARHMYEGGNMKDQLGEYIIESVGNLQKLVEFVRYTRTNKLINETSEDIIKTIKENIATIRKEFKGLTGAKSYHVMSEAIVAREEQVLEEDDTIDLQDIFTVRKFDEKIGDMLPLVRRLMNEKQAWRAALIEASKQTILMHEKEELAEEDVMEFENPVQQVGYKIGKVAKRMVETGDLSKLVSKVADKLIEGETISDFEKTIVRNVLENAKIEENGECDECGCYDCTCEVNKRNTVESVSDDFDLKMKMIEHEDIFEETPGPNQPLVIKTLTKTLERIANEQMTRGTQAVIAGQALEGVGLALEFNIEQSGQEIDPIIPALLMSLRSIERLRLDTKKAATMARKTLQITNVSLEEDAGNYKDCPDCNGGYTQDGKDCKRCEGNGKIYEGDTENRWDDFMKTQQAQDHLATVQRDFRNCPSCKGTCLDANGDVCLDCEGEGGHLVTEEPGDWDHGYNYEGPQRDDDLGYDPKTQWMDPAGGIHDNNEDDPAAMYEDETSNDPVSQQVSALLAQGKKVISSVSGASGKVKNVDDRFITVQAPYREAGVANFDKDHIFVEYNETTDNYVIVSQKDRDIASRFEEDAAGDYEDCERCEGTGSESAAGNPLGSFGDEDDKCILCGGTGKEDFVRGSRQDPFGGNYGVDPEDFMDSPERSESARRSRISRLRKRGFRV